MEEKQNQRKPASFTFVPVIVQLNIVLTCCMLPQCFLLPVSLLPIVFVFLVFLLSGLIKLSVIDCTVEVGLDYAAKSGHYRL